MRPDTISRTIEPSDRLVCGLALIFALLPIVDSNIAMMVSSIGVPFALVWLFRLMRDRVRRSWGLRLLTYASAILLMIAGPTAFSIHTMRLENGLSPVIETLDQYFAGTGHYPSKLADLPTGAEADCRGTLNQPARYYPSKDGTQFSLICTTFGLNRHTYESKTRRWRDWD